MICDKNFINFITCALVWLCCNSIYFNSYVFMFVLWLPLFLMEILHQKRVGSFWLPNNIILYIIIGFLILFGETLLVPHKGDLSGLAIKFFWLFPLIMFGYLYNKSNINKGIRYGLEIVIITGFICSLYDLFILGIDRPRGLMYNCILWASCMSMLLPLFVYGYVYEPKGWRKQFRLGMCALIIINIILTKCRGIMLAIFIVGACLVVLYGLKHYKSYTILAMLIGIGCLSISYFAFPHIFHRSYDGDRLAAWYASWLMFKDHPMFGIGFMQWKDCFATIYAQPNVHEILPHAHNMYLGVLSTTGLMGFTGLLVWLGGWCASCWQQIKSGKIYFKYAAVGIAIFLVHGLFDYVLMAGLYEKVIWMLVAFYQWDIFADMQEQNEA